MMIRRSLVAKSTSLGVVHFLTTLREGPAQGVHIVLVVDVLAAPLQTGAILFTSLFPTLHRDSACQTTPYPGHSCSMQKHFLQRARLVASVIFHEGAKPMSSQRALELGRDFSRVGRPERSLCPGPRKSHRACCLPAGTGCSLPHEPSRQVALPLQALPPGTPSQTLRHAACPDKETAPTTLSLCSMISA